MNLQKAIIAKSKEKEKVESTKIDFNNKFFEMLNGHPHSVILVSSLNNDLTLSAIYNRLVKIRKERNINFREMNELIFSLNVESSVTYIKKKDFQAYKILLLFTLCPDGLSDDIMRKMIPRDWTRIQKILLNKSLLNVYSKKTLKSLDSKNTFKTLNSRVTDTSEIDSVLERSNGKKIFQMESSISKTIISTLEESEIEEADKTVVTQLVQELDSLMKNNKLKPNQRYNELRSLDSNIQEAMNRLYDNKIQKEMETIEKADDEVHVKSTEVRFKFIRHILEQRYKKPEKKKFGRSQTKSVLDLNNGSKGKHSSISEEVKGKKTLEHSDEDEEAPSSTQESDQKSKLVKGFVEEFVQNVKQEEEARRTNFLKVHLMIRKFVKKLKDKVVKRKNENFPRFGDHNEEDKKSDDENLEIIDEPMDEKQPEDDSDIEANDGTPRQYYPVSSESEDIEDEQPEVPATNRGRSVQIRIDSMDKESNLTQKTKKFDGNSGSNLLIPTINEEKEEEEEVKVSSLLSPSNAGSKKSSKKSKWFAPDNRSKTIGERKLASGESSPLLKEKLKGSYTLTIHQQLVVLYCTNQLLSAQYDSFENSVEDAIRLSHETLTLANLYKLFCLEILIRKDNELKDLGMSKTRSLDTDTAKYLYEAQSNLDNCLKKYNQAKCISGCSKVHLLQMIISSRMIEEDSKQGIHDKSSNDKLVKYKNAFSDFKYRTKQVVEFDSRSVGKDLLESVKMIPDGIKDEDLLEDPKVLKFLTNPVISTEQEVYTEFEDKRALYRSNLKITLNSNKRGGETFKDRQISINLEMDDDKDLVDTFRDHTDEDFEIDDFSPENEGERTKVNKGRLFKMLTKSIVKKFGPNTPTSAEKSPSFGNQESSVTGEKKESTFKSLHDAQVSEGFESDELKTEEFKTKEDLVIENLPAFQINIPAEIPMVSSFNSSRNNLAHFNSFDKEPDFNKMTKRLNFSNSCQVKMVKPPNSMFAYPSQYNMKKYLSSSNPGSFNYDTYKKEAKSQYTSILEKSLPMKHNYVPLRKERLSSTQNITVGRPYIKNYPPRYYAEPLSQRSHSRSTNRVKPLRRRSPSLENSRVDLHSSIGSFRQKLERVQYQRY